MSKKTDIFLVILFSAVSIVLVGWIIVEKKQAPKIQKYDDGKLVFYYDNRFSIDQTSDKSVILTDGDEGIIQIYHQEKAASLNQKDPSELASSIARQLVTENDNKTYGEQEQTNKGCDMYHYLYENNQENHQTEIIVFINQTEIYYLLYKNANQKFDLLQSSIELIYQSLEMK